LLKIENDLFYDTVHNRMYCGEGEFKVSEFIAAILATGYEGPYGVEILSDEHRSLDLDEALTRARDTALAQFIKAQES
jgi:sugar phosphate isomerase/epimerase